MSTARPFILTVAMLGSLLTACHPSSNVARCDNLLDSQEETIAQMGGQFRCDPSYDADEQSHCPPTFKCQSVMEWDTPAPTAWVWQANLDDHYLRLNADEMVCEMYAFKAHRIPDYYLTVQRDAVPSTIDSECFSWAVSQVA